MRGLDRAALGLVTLALAASTSSCFAVTDLDRFHPNDAPTGNFENLRLTVRGMDSHVNELFEYRIVDASNTLQSRGIIVPLGAKEATLYATGAVPNLNGPFTLDFYADHDNSGGYDRDPVTQTGDHSWRIPLTAEMLDGNRTYVVAFDHNTSFSVLTSPAPPREFGMPARIQLQNMAAFLGRRVEVRVADASSKRVVAFYRIPSLRAASVPVRVDGMIEDGVTYTVEVYTDDNSPTAPGSVKAFRVAATSTAAGLDVTFDPSTASQVTDAAPP